MAGAILVNPWDTNEVTTAMETALHMDFRDRVRAHDNMVQYVYNFTSAFWVSTFTDQLRETGVYAEVCCCAFTCPFQCIAFVFGGLLLTTVNQSSLCLHSQRTAARELHVTHVLKEDQKTSHGLLQYGGASGRERGCQ